MVVMDEAGSKPSESELMPRDARRGRGPEEIALIPCQNDIVLIQ